MFNPITGLVIPSLKWVKESLVGDLTTADVRDLLSLRPPSSINQIASGPTRCLGPDAPAIVVKQFGLVGWLFSLNIAVVRPHLQSPTLIWSLLEEIDRQPNTRAHLSPINDLVGHPQLVATSGPDAAEARKTFVRALPSLSDVFDETIRQCRALLTKDNIARHLHQLHDQQLSTVASLEVILDLSKQVSQLIHQIMFSIFFGCHLTQPALELLHQVTETVLTPNGMASNAISRELREAFRELITETTTQGLESTNTFSSFSKIIQSKIRKSLNEITLDDKKALRQILDRDPTIDMLMTSMMTAGNIYELVWEYFLQCIHNPSFITQINEEIQANNLSLLSDDSNGALPNINRLPYLDFVFQRCLKRGSFADQDLLIRRTTRAIPTEGQPTIPAGTTVIFAHRALENPPGLRYQPELESGTKAKTGTLFFAPFSRGPRACPGQRIAETIFKGIALVFAQHALKPTVPEEHHTPSASVFN